MPLQDCKILKQKDAHSCSVHDLKNYTAALSRFDAIPSDVDSSISKRKDEGSWTTVRKEEMCERVLLLTGSGCCRLDQVCVSVRVCMCV